MKHTVLLTDWVMKHPVFGNLPCRIPFSMYGTLLEAGKIPDPFYRDQEYALTALSDEEYTFETTFEAAPEQLQNPYQKLRFEGIDTIATIFLNGRQIGQAFNMHRIWEFDIAHALQSGQNRLQILFHSPTRYMQERQSRHFVWGQSDTMEGFAHIRKASCMFGWDWAPKLPDMGLFRPVSWISYATDRIQEVRIHQHHPDQAGTAGRALAPVALELQIATEQAAPESTFSVQVEGPGCHQEVLLSGPQGRIEIPDPKLWWPHGYGEQPLYTVTVTLLQAERPLDVWQRRIGLRTLTVSTAADTWGNEFCFVVNGVKMFAMGADYVPEDSLIGRLSRQRTEKLIQSCIKANFNSIRVWGGGQYPSDDFFDLCDEYGLVVWQDFMFACVNVWLSKEFTENICQEFIDNICRLRDHASLGLLCGNNEMEMAVLEWEGCRDSALAKQDYLQLYEHLLPDLCAEYCPDIFYWPSSPSSVGGFDNPQDENRGDAHYWGAWHGSIPFESYRQYYFRFCSEFGFEAFPNIQTIRSFAEPEDMNPFSLIMESHQKCRSGNTKILSYASDKYLYPYDFSTLVYTSQLLQADAIRYGVEHFRRFRGRCMGAIYWQLNDCWPVASWSSVDYYGRWKALKYSAKRFFAPVLLSAHENGCLVTLNLSNETRDSFTGSVHWQVMDRRFTVYEQGELPASVLALSAADLPQLNLTQALQGKETERFLAYALYDQNGRLISQSSLLLCKPKHFQFENTPVLVRIEGGAGQFTLYVSADSYAKSVELDFANHDLLLSDNYFDITSAAPRLLTAETEDLEVTAEQLLADLTVQTVAGIGKESLA